MSRRGFLRASGIGLAGAALMGAGATACGGGGGSSGNLRWSMWSATPDETKVWEGLANDVTKAHSDIKVDLETVTFDSYWNKLQTQLASGTEADIVAMQSLRMPGFAVRDALQPLQPFIDDDSDFDFDDFFPVIEEGLSFNGEVYAFAYDLGPILLYYNKELFEKAGVPTPSPTEPMSWDEFQSTAEKLTNASAREYGFVIQPNFDACVPWLWSGGGDFMNEGQTECTLDSPESIQALEFIVGMVTDVEAAAPPTDLANTSFASETFFSGKIGMWADGPWQMVNIRANTDFEWDVAPFPAGPAGSVTWVAGSGFGISNSTENPDAAWEALKVLTGTKSLKKVAKAGRGYPGRKSAVPAFEDPDQPPEHVDIVEEILSGEIGEVRPFNTTTTWQETEVMLARDWSPVFLGRQSVEETISTVKPKFDRLLQEHQDILDKHA